MKRVMVRYAVKPDQVQDNERRIHAVFAQLDREQPQGVRYASFKLADGVSFVHIASIETADGSNPLTALETFQQFTGTLAERRVEAPVTVELHQVGSYRVFDR
jgi:hypothetical protein